MNRASYSTMTGVAAKRVSACATAAGRAWCPDTRLGSVGRVDPGDGLREQLRRHEDLGDASFAGETELGSLDDRIKFAVVSPETSSANNSLSCFSWFQLGDTSWYQREALSIKQRVDNMTSAHGSDPARVFVTGARLHSPTPAIARTRTGRAGSQSLAATAAPRFGSLTSAGLSVIVNAGGDPAVDSKAISGFASYTEGNFTTRRTLAGRSSR